MNRSRLVKKDLKTVWHPCTQMKDHEKIPMIPIKSGKGVWLYDYDDNKYLDREEFRHLINDLRAS